MEHIIWQNYDVNIEDYKDYLDEEFPDLDEYEQWEEANELNNTYLEDEKCNLNKVLPTEIIIIGDLGFWNGRVKFAYKELNSNNLSDCLRFERDCEYAKWYVDKYKNLRSKQSHHDGTNYLLYRRWRDGLTDTQKENFLNKMYYGKATEKDITRYTKRLGDIVSEIYGWN